jgi:hypothetical protein
VGWLVKRIPLRGHQQPSEATGAGESRTADSVHLLPAARLVAGTGIGQSGAPRPLSAAPLSFDAAYLPSELSAALVTRLLIDRPLGGWDRLETLVGNPGAALD